MWRRKIAVDDVLAIVRETVKAMQAGGELRVPTVPMEPEQAVAREVAFITSGASEPDYGDEEDEETDGD